MIGQCARHVAAHGVPTSTRLHNGSGRRPSLACAHRPTHTIRNREPSSDFAYDDETSANSRPPPNVRLLTQSPNMASQSVQCFGKKKTATGTTATVTVYRESRC
jgi:hypothetical protein